jgi:hypothetical protein
MANAFVNFLSGVLNGSGNLRDYQHASRLYVSNTYELAPKNGWIYYVVVNINPDLANAITDNTLKTEFNAWYNKYKGMVGLLAKQVDSPKFTVETEILNQYNRKTVVQKRINYDSLSIVFHDDMANVSTNLWKAYYQYYYGDSNDSSFGGTVKTKSAKYSDNKYNEFNGQQTYRYGLNNSQSIPFFDSIDIYQLNQRHYTSFKIVNPIIKSWQHDQLDQTQGNRVLTSKLVVDYETVIYDTKDTNAVTKGNPGFNKNHYDTTPSPLSIGGQGTTSVLGPGGLVAGAKSVFGTLTNPGASPLDLLNAAIQTGNIVRNAKNISTAGLKEEGTGILTSVLSGIEQSPSIPGQTTGQRIISGTLNGLNQTLTPAGINVPTGNKTTNNSVKATPVTIG